MRKLILTLALVLAFTVPAWAGPLIINGILYPTVNTIVQGGTTYVPIRFISENMGYNVAYENGTVKIWQQLREPQIIGDEKFRNIVSQALTLLKTKEPTSYINICQYIDTIEMSEEKGMDAHNNGSRQIFLTKEMVESDRFIPVYVASSLVHETTHAMQFGWGFRRFMTANELEFEAYGKEISILKQLNAPQWMIDGTIVNQNKFKSN